MYYQVPGDGANSQRIIGSRVFKVGVALMSASCLVFLFILASPFSSPVPHGTTAAQSMSLASMPSNVRVPQIAQGVRPAPGFLRFPQITRQSSVLPMGSSHALDRPVSMRSTFQEDAPAPATKMTPRRSVLGAIAAALVPLLRAEPSGAAATSVATKDLPPKIKMLQTIGSWDKNGDGRIDRPEFEVGMKNWVPHELTPDQMDKAWNRIVNVELDIRANDPSFAGNKLTDAQKQLPQPNQPMPLPTDRVESSIPKLNPDGSDGGVYKYPSPQQAFNAMMRKGKDPDISRAKDFVETHNEMNERGWDQVLRYEKVTHPESSTCEGGIKLRKFNGDYQGRPSGSFDRHHWIINRCGKEDMTYVLDYFDTKKYDEITMPYSNDDIEIRVRPDPDDPNAQGDVSRYQKKTGKEFSTTADTDYKAKPMIDASIYKKWGW